MDFAEFDEGSVISRIDEACGDWTCHVLERIPAYEHSGYTRQVVWLDVEAYRMVRTEFYDRKKALLKTLTDEDDRKAEMKTLADLELRLAIEVEGFRKYG